VPQYQSIAFFIYLAQLTELIVCWSKAEAVCISVNQGIPNHNRFMQTCTGSPVCTCHTNEL